MNVEVTSSTLRRSANRVVSCWVLGRVAVGVDEKMGGDAGCDWECWSDERAGEVGSGWV